MQRLLRVSLVAAALAGAASAALAQGGVGARAQDTIAFTGAGDTSVFAPLPLPTPNEYRGADGSPGPAYWQQRADYDIHATLDTAANTLHGELTVHYTNNSPDTLRHVWMQVEQNAFTDSSLNAYIFPQNSRFGARGFEGGDKIEHVDQLVTVHGSKTPRHVALKTRVYDTMMFVALAMPLAPGKAVDIDIAWHFKVPVHGADRMGHDGPLYELAQWYPRMVVYDDVRGWNTDPYVGQGEFYLEYGNITYAVTVPAGYVVAGTGALQNPKDVLTSTEIARLAKAAKSDTTIPIITAKDLTSGAARAKTTGTLTWKFSAKNVRDVAWAGAPNYQWDASSWHGILAQAYYRPSAAETWDDAADQARMSIMEYSERWFQYPYPQITAVEGPISGMEYPMLAMETASQSKPGLYSVVTHEIGHNWFPMIVGSNERIHFWMDEGFNTFINTFSEARRYPEQGSQMQRAGEEREGIEQTQIHDVDIPIDVPADRIDPRKLGFTEYNKTSVGLQLLRQEILGPQAFDDAFRTYIRRWAFKHPTPADFYRTMDDVSGHRLDWFWREWFVKDYHFDQTVDTVLTRKRGDTTDVAVVYGNLDRGVLPILARFTLSDGTTKEYDYPARVWTMNNTQYLRVYTFVGKTLAKIELDPDKQLVDDDRGNNVWTAPAAASGTGAQSP
ncbi:MAG TPA: M1 family metallopeptidase [Gemmatimonadaceae bacterium]|nr:M1 family metallopeptidase [Gemmatimonadaceae bacterium]